MDMDKKLQEYRKALEQEYGLAESPTPQNLASIKDATATKLLKAVPEAVDRILYLMVNAEKEATQLVAAKFVIANALGENSIGDVSDPLASLLKELTKNDQTSQPS